MSIDTKTANNLRQWNLIMGSLHLVQGLIMIWLSKKSEFELVWNLPKIQFANPIVAGQPQAPILSYVGETAFSLNLGYAIAGFLLLSAIAHFVTILPQVYPWYLAKLSKQMNLIRWWEYALSSSVMVVVIAALCNIKDVAIIILLFVVNACMNLFGALMEIHNSTLKEHAKQYNELELKISNTGIAIESQTKSTYKTDWTAFVYGCIAGITPWIIMGVYFFVSIDRIGSVEGLPARVKEVLDTVKWIFPALFVFFNLFAINMFLQYKGVGRWRDYLWGEKMYIVLSLVAKSFLAWFIWGGTLRP